MRRGKQSVRRTYAKFASSWEELSVLVEADSHDSVGSVKGFLHTISVVEINIDVQNACMVPIGSLAGIRNLTGQICVP